MDRYTERTEQGGESQRDLRPVTPSTIAKGILLALVWLALTPVAVVAAILLALLAWTHLGEIAGFLIGLVLLALILATVGPGTPIENVRNRWRLFRGG